MSLQPRDPRKLDFNHLTDAEKDFATLKAWGIAHDLDDRVIEMHCEGL
jgi:hypothetical protein